MQNAHGDVVNLTDADGAVTKTYHYDAFGVELDPTTDDVNVFRYCGEYFDTETGTIYLRARYYQAAIGRFTQRDSVTGELTDPLSLNLYTYCYNNPITGIDPSGNMPKWLSTTLKIAAGVAVVAGAVALTCVLAPALPVGAVVASAAFGAVASASLNVAEQMILEDKELNEINVDDVIISGTAGGVSGAFGVTNTTRVGQALINAGISAASSAARGKKGVDVWESAAWGAAGGFIAGNGGAYDWQHEGVETLFFRDEDTGHYLFNTVKSGIIKATVFSGVVDYAKSKLMPETDESGKDFGDFRKKEIRNG